CEIYVFTGGCEIMSKAVKDPCEDKVEVIRFLRSIIDDPRLTNEDRERILVYIDALERAVKYGIDYNDIEFQNNILYAMLLCWGIKYVNGEIPYF
ncbi:hypothetical protein, partial [Metallosphaera sp.]|uniref:hypothetical protein n=1 Tax=Metallosphaera sp. TaxID=2020860 RepID=UPI003167E3AC